MKETTKGWCIFGSDSISHSMYVFFFFVSSFFPESDSSDGVCQLRGAFFARSGLRAAVSQSGSKRPPSRAASPCSSETRPPFRNDSRGARPAGPSLRSVEATVKVMSIGPGSKAEEAGLMPGDDLEAGGSAGSGARLWRGEWESCNHQPLLGGVCVCVCVCGGSGWF